MPLDSESWTSWMELLFLHGTYLRAFTETRDDDVTVLTIKAGWQNRHGHSGWELRVPVLQPLNVGGSKLAFIISLECHSEFLAARNYVSIMPLNSSHQICV